MSLSFTARPGRFERHCQRMLNNPLFPATERNVVQMEVNAAQRRDEKEYEAFAAAFRTLLEDARKLAPQVESDVIIELKERCDRLYEQCAGLGGERGRELEALKRLTEVIMRQVWAGAGDDPQARKELQMEEQARAFHYQLLQYPLIADLLSPETPIPPQHLAATLLSESEPAVNAALELFDPEQRRELCRQATELLDELRGSGEDLSTARSRLRLLCAEST
jgi:hypothetical protein